MPDPVEKVEELAQGTVVEELAEEAAEGSSERTPWLVMGGVHITVAVIVLLVIAVVGLIYYLAQ